MKISFHLTRRDLIYASLQQLFHQPLVIIIVGLLLMVISVSTWQELSPDKPFLLKLFVMGILNLILITIFGICVTLIIFLASLSKKNNLLLMDQTVTLDSSLFIQETELLYSEVKWKAIQQIIRTKDYLYLYITAVGAILIPRSAFDSSEQSDRFYEFCLENSRKT